MFSLLKPSDAAIASFVAARSGERPSFAQAGLTRQPEGVDAAGATAGYAVDRYEAVVGVGEADFARAREAVLGWRMFELGWVELSAPGPAKPGVDVGVLARLPGLWSLNPCRVVYLDDRPEKATGPECAFGYATLPGHVERGEERFCVRLDPKNERVSYSILAVSRPAAWIARVGAPIARPLQRRFGRGSLDAMRRAVGASG